MNRLTMKRASMKSLGALMHVCPFDLSSTVVLVIPKDQYLHFQLRWVWIKRNGQKDFPFTRSYQSWRYHSKPFLNFFPVQEEILFRCMNDMWTSETIQRIWQKLISCHSCVCFLLGTFSILGFHHEQSRPDRDTYVRVISANIIPGHIIPSGQIEKQWRFIDPIFQDKDITLTSTVVLKSTRWTHLTIIHLSCIMGETTSVFVVLTHLFQHSILLQSLDNGWRWVQSTY